MLLEQMLVVVGSQWAWLGISENCCCWWMLGEDMLVMRLRKLVVDSRLVRR